MAKGISLVAWKECKKLDGVLSVGYIIKGCEIWVHAIFQVVLCWRRQSTVVVTKQTTISASSLIVHCHCDEKNKYLWHFLYVISPQTSSYFLVFCSAVSIIEIEIFTEIKRDRKSDLGILNLSIWQLANGEEHWINRLIVDVDGALISPWWQWVRGGMSLKSVGRGAGGWYDSGQQASHSVMVYDKQCHPQKCYRQVNYGRYGLAGCMVGGLVDVSGIKLSLHCWRLKQEQSKSRPTPHTGTQYWMTESQLCN